MRLGRSIACGLVIASLVAPAAAATPGPLPTVVQDDALLLHRPPEQVDAALARLAALGTDVVRITAGWSVLTRAPDAPLPPVFDQADPAAYEQARWAALDQAVRLASDHGLRPMLDVGFWAPRWAARDTGPRARQDVDARAFAAFAVAVARRYDGTFRPAAVGAVPEGRDGRLWRALFGPPSDAAVRGAPLPRVDLLTLWNEPNHPAFLLPQWRRGEPASPAVYRRMVAAAHPAVKAVRPDATLLVGGTSAHAGGRGVPPLRFVRALACVDEQLEPRRDGACRRFRPVPGDGWAHHPYVLGRPPDSRAAPDRPDDVPLAEVPRLVALLRELVARGRLAPALAEVWITEFGYETAQGGRVSTGDQARWLPWAEELAWRTPGVRSFAQFLLRDVPPAATRTGASVRRAHGQWESGLEFADGRPKLASLAFRAGLHAERRADGRVAVWARARGAAGDDLVVERRAGRRWRPVRLRGREVRQAGTSLVLTGVASLPPGGRLRLRFTGADGQRVAGVPAAPLARR